MILSSRVSYKKVWLREDFTEVPADCRILWKYKGCHYTSRKYGIAASLPDGCRRGQPSYVSNDCLVCQFMGACNRRSSLIKKETRKDISLYPDQMQNANLAHPSKSPDTPRFLTTTGIRRKVLLHAIGGELAIGRQVSGEGCA